MYVVLKTPVLFSKMLRLKSFEKLQMSFYPKYSGYPGEQHLLTQKYENHNDQKWQTVFETPNPLSCPECGRPMPAHLSARNLWKKSGIRTRKCHVYNCFFNRKTFTLVENVRSVIQRCGNDTLMVRKTAESWTEKSFYKRWVFLFPFSRRPMNKNVLFYHLLPPCIRMWPQLGAENHRKETCGRCSPPRNLYMRVEHALYVIMRPDNMPGSWDGRGPHKSRTSRGPKTNKQTNVEIIYHLSPQN